jgi:hypothetical protein
MTTMSAIPNDPMMLLSWVNLKLRDFYPSLDALCEDLEIEKSTILDKLSSIGFEYNPEQNRFW